MPALNLSALKSDLDGPTRAGVAETDARIGPNALLRTLRAAGIVAEAQFIIGLENETAESIEDTCRWAMDWDCDMANWIMYTPWPFSDLFEGLGDKVEVRD